MRARSHMNGYGVLGHSTNRLASPSSTIGEYPDVVFVFITQVDWTEKMSRGSSSWPHAVDIRLWTEVNDERQQPLGRQHKEPVCAVATQDDPL